MTEQQNKFNKSCCIILNSLLLFILFIVMLIMLLDYHKSNSLILDKCNITNVIYPTRLPLNHSDMAGFSTCDCGRRCKSDLGICISVYGNTFNYQNSMIFKNNFGDSNLQCTYQEINCINGENIQNRLTAINEAKDIAQQYIDMMNTTIDCYLDRDNNELYFSNDFNETAMYIIIGCFCFLIFTLILLNVNVKRCFKRYFTCCFKEQNNENV